MTRNELLGCFVAIIVGLGICLGLMYLLRPPVTYPLGRDYTPTATTMPEYGMP